MFNNYLIIENKLILFIDFHYEFSIFGKSSKKSIKASIKDYIKENKINFKKGTVLLAVGTIIIASLSISNKNISLNEIKEESIITTLEKDILNKTTSFSKQTSNIDLSNSKVKKQEVKKEENKSTKTTKKETKKSTTSNNKSNSNKTSNTTTNKKSTKTNTKASNTIKQASNDIVVTIYRSTGKVESINLEDYVVGVVAAEMPASFNIEALKAQSILARTYALKAIKNNKKLTDTVSTQAYIDTTGMKNKWGSSYETYYNKIKTAATSTKGMYITYNNEIIDAVYHSTSNGYTEDPIEVWGYSVPYLKVTESFWDKNVSSYEKTITKDKDEIFNILGITSLDEIKIQSRNSSGRVSKVTVKDKTYTGVDIRSLLGLRSTDFDISIKGDKIVITTKGYGHGVGMSQYGSNEMAKKGYKYNEIINYYYKNIKISKL